MPPDSQDRADYVRLANRLQQSGMVRDCNTLEGVMWQAWTVLTTDKGMRAGRIVRRVGNVALTVRRLHCKYIVERLADC